MEPFTSISGNRLATESHRAVFMSIGRGFVVEEDKVE
jgi:hypothetical protein